MTNREFLNSLPHDDLQFWLLNRYAFFKRMIEGDPNWLEKWLDEEYEED